MPEPKIFITPSRQKSPVPRDILQDLSSPVAREAWHREAASITEELARLVQEFERDFISKEEFLTKVKRLYSEAPSISVDALFQEGPEGKLYLSSLYNEWSDADHRYIEKANRDMKSLWRKVFVETFPYGLRRRLDYTEEPAEFADWSGQHDFGAVGPEAAAHIYWITHTMQRWNDNNPRAARLPGGQRDARNPQEFLTAWEKAMSYFKDAVEGYKNYLQHWDGTIGERMREQMNPIDLRGRYQE